MSGVKDQANPHAVLEWKLVIRRWDELPMLLKRVMPQHVNDVYEKSRASAMATPKKSDEHLLTIDKDSGAITPDDELMAQYDISDEEEDAEPEEREDESRDGPAAEESTTPARNRNER